MTRGIVQMYGFTRGLYWKSQSINTMKRRCFEFDGFEYLVLYVMLCCVVFEVSDKWRRKPDSWMHEIAVVCLCHQQLALRRWRICEAEYKTTTISHWTEVIAPLHQTHTSCVVIHQKRGEFTAFTTKLIIGSFIPSVRCESAGHVM